jgi:hypothetical protein
MSNSSLKRSKGFDFDDFNESLAIKFSDTDLFDRKESGVNAEVKLAGGRL